jgi:hypothetical protein
VEIFLAPKVAAKRAPTFQINVAVTNFAPERIVSDKRGSAADKCIRKKHILGIADNFGIEGEKSSPQMTINKKKKKMGREKAAITNGWRLCSYCNGVVATVAGRRENSESELNTWRSAAIFATVLA